MKDLAVKSIERFHNERRMTEAYVDQAFPEGCSVRIDHDGTVFFARSAGRVHGHPDLIECQLEDGTLIPYEIGQMTRVNDLSAR